MAHSHSHSHGHHHGAGAKNEQRLALTLGLTSLFVVVEIAAGIFSGSLALLSDAAHMFSDVAGLTIALLAMKIGKRPANARKTYGYYRLEILASAFNAILLFLVGIYIVYEAWRRFAEPAEIHSLPMLIVAALGLIVNFIGMQLLADGKEQSLNMKGAYLEVWSDFLGSAGVIVAALIIMASGWLWVDSLVAVLIGIWVLPRSWTLLGESVNILLQGAPKGIAVSEIEMAPLSISGVSEIHNLHVWSLTSSRNVITAHIVTKTPAERFAGIRKDIEKLLEERHDLHLSTIQIEDESEACKIGAGHAHGQAHEHP